MSALPAGVRRLLGAVVAAGVVLGPSAATLWVSTPSGTDIQARVAALTRSYGVALLNPDEIPSTLAKAVVATEDERFYTHHGIDSIGLARALLYDASNRCLCQGGSTITEQLVKDVYLGGSDRGYNKLVDAVLALKVDRILTKQQIMADYLSEIATGFGRVRLLPVVATEPHAGPVRAAGRGHPGAFAIRPDRRPRGRRAAAQRGAGFDDLRALHHAGAGAGGERRAGAGEGNTTGHRVRCRCLKAAA